jgi:Tol biopolymer transport system component
MPAFSPDGRYLAFVRARKSEANAIYAVPIAPETMPVGEPIRLMPDNWNVLGLAWASDGRSLIFSTGGHVGITRLQRLPFAVALAGRPVEPDVLPFGEHATAVSISQTGRLVYASDTRDSNLWALPLARPNRPVGPSPVAPSTYDDHTPDYSPDGKRLAFASNRSGDEEIWIADSDGSNAVQATSMKGPLCANPRWSPDGTRILFTSRREGSQDLYLLFPDTGDYRRITDDPAEEVEPRWSRDGRWIYFGSNRTGRPEVWKMPAGGGAAKRITQHGGLSASESPDGRFLYYAKNFSSPTSVWRVPVDGGEEALVVHGLSYSLNFVVAERGLYFLAVGDAPQKTAIMFFEYATGKTTSLFAVNKWWWLGMALSPDERTLMYSIVDGWGSDLMLVDRFQ